MSLCSGACELQLLSPHATTTETQARQSLCSATRKATTMRSPHNSTREQPPLTITKAQAQQRRSDIAKYTFQKRIVTSVQFSSVTQSCPTLCDPMDCSTPGLPVHLKLMSIKSVMSSNHLILCHPFLCPPSIFPSIRVFSNESALGIRWQMYWSFSFNISPSNEYPSPLGWTG